VREHLASLAASGERLASGPDHELLEQGDEVTWEARHLGLTWRLQVRITDFRWAEEFVDEQVSGPFAYMRHRHRFFAAGGGTTMVDDFEYELPFGPLGLVADRLLVRSYLRRLLAGRNDHLKDAAQLRG
jgi:ligand-binding SRPBCC domain-containing protein